jgi:putative membrane protein
MMMGFGFFGILLVIALIALMVGRLPQGGQTIFKNIGSSQSPREILEARYAKGEINKQEYDQMREDLSK